MRTPHDRNLMPPRSARGPSGDQQVHVREGQGARGELEVRQRVQAAGVRDWIQKQVEQGRPAGSRGVIILLFPFN